MTHRRHVHMVRAGGAIAHRLGLARRARASKAAVSPTDKDVSAARVRQDFAPVMTATRHGSGG